MSDGSKSKTEHDFAEMYSHERLFFGGGLHSHSLCGLVIHCAKEMDAHSFHPSSII